MPPRQVSRIRSVIGSLPLARAVHRSVSSALRRRFVHVAGGRTVWGVFSRSLDAAVRDIQAHPRGKLFRRLIEYGPHHPDDPEAPTSDGETVLSNPECGQAVEFIFSHMVNRFKGELAELLTLEPCLELIGQLQRGEHQPPDAELYWGDTVQERLLPNRAGRERWGKGADGLLVDRKAPSRMNILGIVEVKSMRRALKTVNDQIGHHLARLDAGVRLLATGYSPGEVAIDPGLVRIVAMPSTWKLSRDWHWQKGANGGRMMVFPEPPDPPTHTRIEQLGPTLWKIVLDWSQEALEQAAYEMTYGYMAEVGKHVFSGKPMPKGWQDFTPQEAGYNAIKMMLYYMPLRYLSPRRQRLAIKLYNVYGFGYPLGVDSKEMIWPEELSPDTSGESA